MPCPFSHAEHVDLQRNVQFLHFFAQPGHLPVVYRIHSLIIHQIRMGKIGITSRLHSFNHEIHISADTAFILRLCTGIWSHLFGTEKMLSHNHIITSKIPKQPHLLLIKLRNVFRFKSNIYFYLILILCF